MTTSAPISHKVAQERTAVAVELVVKVAMVGAAARGVAEAMPLVAFSSPVSVAAAVATEAMAAMVARAAVEGPAMSVAMADRPRAAGCILVAGRS